MLLDLPDEEEPSSAVPPPIPRPAALPLTALPSSPPPPSPRLTSPSQKGGWEIPRTRHEEPSQNMPITNPNEWPLTMLLCSASVIIELVVMPRVFISVPICWSNGGGGGLCINVCCGEWSPVLALGDKRP